MDETKIETNLLASTEKPVVAAVSRCGTISRPWPHWQQFNPM
jgi:hypothetical protein